MRDVPVNGEGVDPDDVGGVEERDEPTLDDRAVVRARGRLQVAAGQIVIHEVVGELCEGDAARLPPLLALHLLKTLAELALCLRLVPLRLATEPLPALSAVVVTPPDREGHPRFPSRRTTAAPLGILDATFTNAPCLHFLERSALFRLSDPAVDRS
jgi:hypothetical protein